MSQQENYHNRHLGRFIISNTELYSNNYWSPCIEKQLLKELKSTFNLPVKRVEKFKSQNQAIYLLIGFLASLSIGLCIQANSITQTLREVARISVQQIYSK
ncbi:hypothetical protein DSM106972_050630 [Dulcicalothrix desertica PCC 7102]|uniref:Uncharacterized protein n=1 Tax=Dulcicalothrix desertica PCC 7102 TaxID=232991 RepID=A0A433VBD2_9CYAN|nr:hypothetical protein [Dulcicalothrix desertica]RUT03424.1 hypothetical protein DSM106972_050630 [Dulcicalothrix desertica PCC 7102]TWH50652.1 hypothetical protein CAL7102_04982 [Dulcicalothrix desertica PCC 7102]BDA68897.1 hypothetical protein CAL7716_030630 [Calothrix sp. PCC 7716]GJD16740.1 hypothetical protein RIVM261_016960 [Rivularia sp. IAM M-261]